MKTINQINMPDIKIEFNDYGLIQKNIMNDENLYNVNSVSYNTNYKNNNAITNEEGNNKKRNSDNLRYNKKNKKIENKVGIFASNDEEEKHG